MALQKTIQNSTGGSASYWRIVIVSTNYETSTANILIHGYIDKIARDNGKSPLDMRSYYVMGQEFQNWFSVQILDQTGSNSVKNSYLYIKSIPNGEFLNSIDA